MRILVCASEAPVAPLNGLRLQIRALTEALALRHDVHVLAYAWPGQDGPAPEGVRLQTVPPPAGGRISGWLRAAVDHRPIEAVKLTRPMADALIRFREREEPFDVAHVSNGEIAGVAPALTGVPAVLAPLDAWDRNVAAQVAAATGLRRRVLIEQARRVRRFVAAAYAPYAHVVLVSEEDARATAAMAPGVRAVAIPNGVDTERFTPGDAAGREPGLIVFTGAMHFAPNVLAARLLVREVLPLVRREHPDARVAIVGRGPLPEVQRLAGDGVEITGEVPDVRPWLRRAAVFACPMAAGTGVKNKLLEALACGAPAVVTPLASQGIALHDGEHALVAAEAGGLAQAISRVLGDPGLGERLGAAGRSLVEREHGWDAVAHAHERLYSAAIGGRAATGSGAT